MGPIITSTQPATAAAAAQPRTAVPTAEDDPAPGVVEDRFTPSEDEPAPIYSSRDLARFRAGGDAGAAKSDGGGDAGAVKYDSGGDAGAAGGAEEAPNSNPKIGPRRLTSIEQLAPKGSSSTQEAPPPGRQVAEDLKKADAKDVAGIIGKRLEKGEANEVAPALQQLAATDPSAYQKALAGLKEATRYQKNIPPSSQQQELADAVAGLKGPGAQQLKGDFVRQLDDNMKEALAVKRFGEKAAGKVADLADKVGASGSYARDASEGVGDRYSAGHYAGMIEKVLKSDPPGEALAQLQKLEKEGHAPKGTTSELLKNVVKLNSISDPEQGKRVLGDVVGSATRAGRSKDLDLERLGQDVKGTVDGLKKDTEKDYGFARKVAVDHAAGAGYLLKRWGSARSLGKLGKLVEKAGEYPEKAWNAYVKKQVDARWSGLDESLQKRIEDARKP